MVVNSLTKTVLVIKHKHFLGMRRIEDKKELLASSNKKIISEMFFNNKKLISANCLGLELLYPDMYKITY